MKRERDFTAEIRELIKQYPEILGKSLPDEVVDAAMGGMDLTEAMEAAEVTITNRFMKQRYRLATDYVCHGMTLTNAFESTRLFPTMLIKMVAIGEKTNSLDDVLTRSCSFFDAQLEASFNSFSSKIQPIMLMIMGLVVGSMFIAIYSPMLSIMGTL